MKYTILGNTGVVVSKIAFGALTFTKGTKATKGLSENMGAFYKVGAALANEIVAYALDAGVNFFDTADVYSGGESEELLGAALRTRRSSVVLATKVGSRTGAPLSQSGLSRRHILWSVDESLRRLGTDWIDLYIAHREDPFTPLEETLDAFDFLVRTGKIRYIGFSNWSAWKVAAALEIQRANGLAPFSHGQMYYSLLGRDVERDVIPMMGRYGIGLTAYSPLASGFLSGAYTKESLSHPDNRFSSVDILPFDKQAGFQLVERLRAIAHSHAATVAQIAIAWLLSRIGVNSVIVGATKMQQIKDNIGACDVSLTAENLAELDAATVMPIVYPNWFLERIIDHALVDATRL